MPTSHSVDPLDIPVNGPAPKRHLQLAETLVAAIVSRGASACGLACERKSYLIKFESVFDSCLVSCGEADVLWPGFMYRAGN